MRRLVGIRPANLRDLEAEMAYVIVNDFEDGTEE